MPLDDRRTVVAQPLDTGAKVPQVTVTLDVAAWEFIFQQIETSEFGDECVQVIRRACAKALKAEYPFTLLETP